MMIRNIRKGEYMEEKEIKCPHCGASVKAEAGKNSFFCKFCGGQITVSSEDGNNKIEGFIKKNKKILIIGGAAILSVILILLIILGIVKHMNTGVYRPSVEDSVDVNKYTEADYREVVMGKIREESMLIVAEQEVSVTYSLEKEGWISWDVFKKTQQIKDYGTVQYTVDLNGIKDNDVVYDRDTNTLIIYVPKPEIHEVFLKPDKREVGDPENGFLAWGSIKLTQDETAALDAESIVKLRQVAEETIDRSVIEEATVKALKDLLSTCVSKVGKNTRLQIRIDR